MNTYNRQNERADEPKHHSSVTIQIIRTARVRGDIVKSPIWTPELQSTLHKPPHNNLENDTVWTVLTSLLLILC